jgi:hypothetical protein
VPWLKVVIRVTVGQFLPTRRGRSTSGPLRGATSPDIVREASARHQGAPGVGLTGTLQIGTGRPFQTLEWAAFQAFHFAYIAARAAS